MGRMKRFPILLFMLSISASAASAADLNGLRLPAGFHASVFAEVPGARSLAVADPLHAVFIGTRDDAVYIAVDRDADGRAEQVRKIAGGMAIANGVAWRDGWLYVGEQRRVLRFRATDPETAGRTKPEVVLDGLPDKRHHGRRYLAFGPDGLLYVAVGSLCNVCAPREPEGTILRMNVDTGKAANVEIYARGIRNSVGMDFQPGTNRLHFTDNGSDGLGDDIPPDELNRADRAGAHYGFPWFGGSRARTPEFSGSRPPDGTIPPVVAFGAHVAALGVHFYRGTAFPADYRNDAFVAQHGSWNRSVPDGYRIMRVRFEGGEAKGTEVFADGWLQDSGRVWGRPVDVKEDRSGALLISDDRAGAVYRIVHDGP